MTDKDARRRPLPGPSKHRERTRAAEAVAAEKQAEEIRRGERQSARLDADVEQRTT